MYSTLAVLYIRPDLCSSQNSRKVGISQKFQILTKLQDFWTLVSNNYTWKILLTRHFVCHNFWCVTNILCVTEALIAHGHAHAPWAMQVLFMLASLTLYGVPY